MRSYLENARAQLQAGPDARVVFIGRDGQGITCGVVGNLVHAYIKKSGIGKSGSCHLFRHAMATHMLAGGCDIRHIQVILGHSELTTTQIYTHVSIQQLKDIHAATHPARLAKSPPSEAQPPTPR